MQQLRVAVKAYVFVLRLKAAEWRAKWRTFQEVVAIQINMFVYLWPGSHLPSEFVHRQIARLVHINRTRPQWVRPLYYTSEDDPVY